MATVTLHPDPQNFPIGSTAKVYAVPTNAPAGYVGSGAPASEPTVEAGSGGGSSVLTVTGVTAGKPYVAQRESGGVVYTLYFNGGEVTSGGTEGITKAEAETLANAAESGAVTAAATAAASKDATAKTTTLSEAATKDATVKTEAEAAAAAKDTTAIASAEAGAKTAGDAAYRKQSTAITVRRRETASLPGTVANESLLIPMGIVSLGSGETQKAVKLQAKIQSGTKVTGKMRRKNGAGAIEDLTGFTAVEATTTISSKTPTAVTLADGDELYFLIESAEGTPKGLAITLDVDGSV